MLRDLQIKLLLKKLEKYRLENGDDHSGRNDDVTDEESRRFQMLMKAFKPPPEEGEITPTRKKKMFSSSSFYEEPKHIYPTVEEQVKLCKSIADSLSSDSNQMSRGANMYIKRMKRAHKWVTEGPDPVSSDGDSPQIDPHPPPFETPDGRPRLKLVLDPRQLQDAVKLAKTGMYNEHNVISPDICFEIVRDLNSPSGKGAQLFAKRKKKSEKWIVDESSVKEAQAKQQQQQHQINYDLPELKNLHQKPFSYTQPPPPTKKPPQNKLQEINQRLNPRVKYVKSPWEAALESPIGSCDAAFEELPRKSFVLPSSLPAQGPAPPLKDILEGIPGVPSQRTQSQGLSSAPKYVQPTTTSPGSVRPEVYRPKMPQGWTGHSTDQYSWSAYEPEPLESEYYAPPSQQQPSRDYKTTYQKYDLNQFNNYNATPLTWEEAKHKRNAGFKPVRPKSMVLTK